MRTLVLGSMPKDASPATHIAAGPWCFAGQEEDFPDWANQFEFAPEPFVDPELLPVASHAAQTVAARIIPEIAKVLDPSSRELPLDYWQVLLGPWAINVASQFVERSLRCAAMIQKWQDESLLVPVAPGETNFAFLDENDYVRHGILDINFNFWLFSRILRDRWPEKWQAREQVIHPAKYSASKPSLKIKLRLFIRDFLLNLPFPRLKGFSAGQAFLFSRALLHQCHSKDQSRPLQSFIDEKSLDNIWLPEKNLEIFKRCLPLSIKNLKHVPIKKTPRSKLRVCSVIAYEHSKYRQILARWRAAGNRLAFVQHGCNYGALKVVGTTEFVEYAQDVFFTWGWNKQGNMRGNFCPLPYPQLNNIADSWSGADSEALIFVGTQMATFAYRLDSSPTPLEMIGYRDAKARFFSSLSDKIVAKSFYRPYFNWPNSLEDASWLLPKFPALKELTGPLQPHLLKCRLLVLDHPGTTMLEALAANIPFVLYWNPRYWTFTEEYNELLELLSKRGIYNATPQEAANMVMRVWDNVADWWHETDIQSARLAYCEKQARTVTHGLDDIWISKLKSL